MLIVKFNSIFFVVIQLVYAIPALYSYLTIGKFDLFIILAVVEWALTLSTIVVITISIVKDKPQLMKVASNLVLVR
jgi:hypothetical protein